MRPAKISPRVIELDILGQVCPACLLVVLKQINENLEDLRNKNRQLLVRTDHRDTTRTVPAAATKMGIAVTVRKVATYYEILIGGQL